MAKLATLRNNAFVALNTFEVTSMDTQAMHKKLVKKYEELVKEFTHMERGIVTFGKNLFELREKYKEITAE